MFVFVFAFVFASGSQRLWLRTFRSLTSTVPSPTFSVVESVDTCLRFLCPATFSMELRLRCCEVQHVFFDVQFSAERVLIAAARAVCATKVICARAYLVVCCQAKYLCYVSPVHTPRCESHFVSFCLMRQCIVPGCNIKPRR